MQPNKYCDKPIIKIYSKLAGQTIRSKRIELGYTQEQLAEKVDLDDKHLGRIERGEKTPLGPTLISIFHALQIDANELYDLYEQALHELKDDCSSE